MTEAITASSDVIAWLNSTLRPEQHVERGAAFDRLEVGVVVRDSELLREPVFVMVREGVELGVKARVLLPLLVRVLVLVTDILSLRLRLTEAVFEAPEDLDAVRVTEFV